MRLKYVDVALAHSQPPPPSPPCARRGQNVPSKNAMHLRKQLKVGPKDKSVKVAPYHSSLWLGCKVGRKRDLTCTAWLVNLDRHKVRYVCPTHLKVVFSGFFLEGRV